MANLTIGDMTATLVGLAVIAVAWKPVRKVLRFMETIAADWSGAAERRDESGAVIEAARPGVMAQLGTIRHELFANSGLSLRDQTNRIEKTLKSHIAETAERRERADVLTRTVQDDILPVAQRLSEQLES